MEWFKWLNLKLADTCDAILHSSLCDDLFNYGYYIKIGGTCIVVSLVMVMIFYKLIDNPSFRQWYHWATILAVNFVINFMIGFLIPYLDSKIISLFIDVFKYALLNSFFSIVCFFILSLIVKRFSKNCQTTPF